MLSSANSLVCVVAKPPITRQQLNGLPTPLPEAWRAVSARRLDAALAQIEDSLFPLPAVLDRFFRYVLSEARTFAGPNDFQA